MKLAYLVAAHYNPQAFASLLRAVDGAPVIAHIDAKTDIAPFTAVATPNVTFTERRECLQDSSPWPHSRGRINPVMSYP